MKKATIKEILFPLILLIVVNGIIIYYFIDFDSFLDKQELEDFISCDDIKINPDKHRIVDS